MHAAQLSQNLAAQSLFADCDADELADIILRGHHRSYKPGQTIMAQGDEGATLAILLGGIARVSMVASNGRDIVLDYAEAGSVLGEIAFLDGGERTATVTAIEPADVLTLSRPAFDGIVARHQGLALRLLRAMARRLRQNTAVIEADRAWSAGPRLAQFLLRLMIGGSDGKFKLALSQAELGNFAGMSREQINRQLSSWAESGVLALDAGRVRILDRTTLSEIAEGW